MKKEPSQLESEFATESLKKELLMLPKISSKVDIRTTYSGFLTSMNTITPKKILSESSIKEVEDLKL